MIGILSQFLTLILFIGPFTLGLIAPIVPRKRLALTSWEWGAVIFGLAAGPLAMLSLRGSGFGAFYGMVVYELCIPTLAAAISRSTRPMIFGLAGCSGWFIGFVVMYFTYPTQGPPDTTPPALMILLIAAYIFIPAAVLSIPFAIKAHKFLKRNPDVRQ